MKSVVAILNQTSQDLIIDEIEIPSKLESGQVLVRVITSGICGAQINEIDAVKGPDKFLPHLLGHEGYCEVLEIARDVSTVKVGDRAIMHWRPGSGIQSTPPKYRWNGRDLNAGWVTTFNQYAVVSENRVTSIDPSSISPNTLPLLGCALTTAYGVLRNEARVTNRDSILIFGAGGVGLTMLKILISWGLANVVLIDIDKNKVELARSFGASKSLVFENKNECIEKLHTLYDKDLPTVAIETTGKVPCIEISYECSDPKARVILVGVPKKGEKSSIYTLPLHFGKVFVGSQGGGSQPQIDIPHLLGQLESGALNFSDFPVSTFRLEDINQAIMSLRSGLPGRMIIEMDYNK
jgi:S-(hydroxymethyl)glutathione dehydrogenase/alcohol dehydrogenase